MVMTRGLNILMVLIATLMVGQAGKQWQAMMSMMALAM
jgi:hypothetical protein